MKRAYPALVPIVKIKLVEMLPTVLAMYSKDAQKYTIESFKKHKIDMLFSSKVNAVRQDYVTLQTKEGDTTEIPYGLCVWATGVALNPLVK